MQQDHIRCLTNTLFVCPGLILLSSLVLLLSHAPCRTHCHLQLISHRATWLIPQPVPAMLIFPNSQNTLIFVLINRFISGFFTFSRKLFLQSGAAGADHWWKHRLPLNQDQALAEGWAWETALSIPFSSQLYSHVAAHSPRPHFSIAHKNSRMSHGNGTNSCESQDLAHLVFPMSASTELLRYKIWLIQLLANGQSCHWFVISALMLCHLMMYLPVFSLFMICLCQRSPFPLLLYPWSWAKLRNLESHKDSFGKKKWEGKEMLNNYILRTHMFIQIHLNLLGTVTF